MKRVRNDSNECTESNECKESKETIGGSSSKKSSKTSNNNNNSNSKGVHLSAWQSTIETAIKSVVSIRFSQVSAFDTETAETSEATGFVVDRERGIIVTNRHVACSGPFVGEALWHDHEEALVFPVYRDPVHDFGFLRFDPAKLKYMLLHQIPLCPHLASVGIDIRVVGNDAGEKLSILAGSISRLDRNAPDYGELTYNDFNTFYLQAASSTSGGSSGSPVLDIHGNAVGLQAGGHQKAATDFFLPLDRVVRALKLLQAGKPVERGTIQTQFYHRPYDEVRRLGLKENTEAQMRALDPNEIGMLCVEVVLPEGPASNILQDGDILISIDGKHVTKFVPLEEFLDDSVGKTLDFKIERGGTEFVFKITVQDLHSITPNQYLEFCGATLNNLSYQLARQYCVPCKGVYVSSPMGGLRFDGSTESGWIIDSVNSIETTNIHEFLEAVKDIPDRSRITITYYSIADIHCKSMTVLDVDRHWSRLRLATRNDSNGLWDFQNFDEVKPELPILTLSATFPPLDKALGPSQKILFSLVKVSMALPIRIEGFSKNRTSGSGLVIDIENGLVIVGRNIVPYGLGDISLTFIDSIIIPCQVHYLHPTLNIVILKFDVTLIGTTPIKSAPISDAPILQGHKITLVAYTNNSRTICTQTTVTEISPVVIPPNINPRFRAINFGFILVIVDAVTIDSPVSQQCSSGVLTDSNGDVQGLWLSFTGDRNASSGKDNEYYLGLDVRPFVRMILASYRVNRGLKMYGMAAEFSPVPISQCRTMGLSEKWVHRIEKTVNLSSTRRVLFMVRRVEAGSGTSTVLKNLDLVISVNGVLATQLSTLDLVSDMADTPTESVLAVVIRSKVELELNVPCIEMSGATTDHIVIWAGATFQSPHKAVLQQSKSVFSGVYCVARAKGSPAYAHGICPTQWITHVNDVPTPTLAAFAACCRSLCDLTYARIRTMSFDQFPAVISVKTGDHYWPMSELKRDERGWRVV